MNNTNNSDVLLKPILNPALSDTGYANGIEQMISNINENFALIANRDFVKGDMGSSVEIIEVPIFDEYTGDITNDICMQLKDFICSLINIESDRYISDDPDLDYLRNFTKDNAGSLYLIYNINGDRLDPQTDPISSLQYIFLDGRFWNTKIGNVDNSLYEGIEDMSCVIIYDKNEGFKSLNGAFPTLYYESGVGFCWMLNGKTTGIPVQGLPGKDGINSLLRIVKVDELSGIDGFDLKSAEVVKVFETFSGWIDLNEEIINSYVNSSALIIDNSSKIYLGSTSLNDDNVLIATCDPSISLNDIVSNTSIKNSLKGLNLTESSIETNNLQGLFIPIDHPENKTDDQKAHLLSASSIISTEDTVTKNDVIFTPVKNINELTVTEEKPLQVDKYLYLRFNPESGILNNVVSGIGKLADYNYYLKYKLVDIITNKDDEYLKPTSDNFATILYNDKEIALKSDEVSYFIGDDYQPSLDYKESILVDFEKHNLYVWQLCNDKNVNYDIDELLEVTQNSNSYSGIPTWLNTICTTTFTPSISSEILWFNGLEVLGLYYIETPAIYGWNNTLEESPFEFIKFVPVFNDKDFHLKDDTSINFNYNVNITGCDHEGSNVKHNLTVHGDVNCDNINVYKLTATGEIDNVYTKNNIKTEKGLETARIKIGEDANITGVETVFTETINAKNTNTEFISAINDTNTGKIITNGLSITRESESLIDVNVGDYDVDESPYVDENVATIDIRNSKNITLNKTSLKKTNLGNAVQEYVPNDSISPKITTNMPIVAIDKSSIVITNDSPNNVYVDENLTKKLYDNINKWKNDSSFMGGYHLADEYKKLPLDANDYDVAKMILGEKLRYESNDQILDKEVTINNIDNSVKDSDSIFEEDVNDDGVKSYTYDIPNLSKETLCSFSISKSAAGDSFSLKEIKINLSQFKFGMGLYTHCSYGCWPMITKESKLTLYYRVSFYNKDSKSPSKVYDYPAGSYTFENADQEWKHGVLENGTSVKDNNYSSWRFKSYTLNPKSITISSSTLLKEIKKWYDDDNNTVEISIYPKFEISAKSSTNKNGNTKNVVDDLKILKLVSTGKTSSQTNIMTVDSKYNITGSSYKDNTSKLIYSTSSIGNNENYSTILCNNGIVIGASNSVFGLGYSTISNEPELYYYQKSNAADGGKPRRISLNSLFDKLNSLS